jgi:hypothetical protein
MRRACRECGQDWTGRGWTGAEGKRWDVTGLEVKG